MASPARRLRVALLVALVSGDTARAVAQRGGGGAGAGGGGQPPVLTAFSINAGGDTVSATAVAVVLVHTSVGARPSEYRVSHRADFLGADWQAYTETPLLRDWYEPAGDPCDASRPSHRVTLYLQVRATVGEEVRIVDGQRQLRPARVESNVLKATICAR